MRKLMIALMLSGIAAPAFAQEVDGGGGRQGRGEMRVERQQQVERTADVQTAQRGDGGRQSSWGQDPRGGWQGRQAAPQQQAQAPVFQAPAVQAPVQRPQQARPEGGNWGGRGNWGNQGARINPVQIPQSQAPQQQRADMGGWNRDGGGWRSRQQGQAVPAPAPTPQPRVENRNWESARVDNRGGENRNWGGNGDGNRWGNRTPQAPPAPQGNWNNGNRGGTAQTWNRGNDGRWNRQDGARQGGDWNRNDNGGWQRRDNDRHDDNRWGSNNGWNNNQSWNRGWRSDQRYNWQGYRNQYRNYYQQPRYYNPYGYSYGYERFGIGIYLDNLFFSSRYWISDPWQYRLPSAPYGYRWVRYYDDVLLVNTRSGYVVDVIYSFFY
jgi:Nickel/cobalt transporter regulator